MSLPCTVLATPPLTADRGRWTVEVPWGLLNTAHDHLRRRGCPSTLCIDPAARQAHLVLWPGVDPTRALELLRQLAGHPPSLSLLAA
jgi:hypothetical protein